MPSEFVVLPNGLIIFLDWGIEMDRHNRLIKDNFSYYLYNPKNNGYNKLFSYKAGGHMMPALPKYMLRFSIAPF